MKKSFTVKKRFSHTHKNPCKHKQNIHQTEMHCVQRKTTTKESNKLNSTTTILFLLVTLHLLPKKKRSFNTPLRIQLK